MLNIDAVMGLLLPLVVVVVVLAVSRYLASSWRYLSLPSPGLPLPVIGHIHLLLCQESKNDPVNFLWKLWKKHQRGGVMYLKSFSLNLVFVGEHDTLKYMYNHPEIQLRMTNTTMDQLTKEDRKIKSKEIPGVILREASRT